MKRTILSLLISIITLSYCNSQTIEIVAGTGNSGYSGDGTLAINAELYYPRHLVFDNIGNMYFADQKNHVIRKIDTNGIISTVAGNGTQGYSGDGTLAISAQLDNPRGICIDNNDNLLISDSGNNVVRKIDGNGIISTIAGNGSPSFFGDNGLAVNAALNSPIGINVDDLNNIYIADFYNHRIRKVDTNGTISTIAGNGTTYSTGDGDLAINAGLDEPYDVVYKNDNIWIADFGAGRIRKINSSGIILTIINQPDGSTISGSPSALSFDSNNNLYFSNLSGGIYKIDALDNVSLEFDADTWSGGIAFDMDFNLYHSDTFGHQIRKISNEELNIEDFELNNSVKIYPNPSQDYFRIEFKDLSIIQNIYLYDSKGRILKKIDQINLSFLNNNTLKLSCDATGIYYLIINSPTGQLTKKIIKY